MRCTRELRDRECAATQAKQAEFMQLRLRRPSKSASITMQRTGIGQDHST